MFLRGAVPSSVTETNRSSKDTPAGESSTGSGERRNGAAHGASRGWSGADRGVLETGRLTRSEASVGPRSEGRISSAPTIARTGESVRRGTESHERRPTWQQGGPPPTRSSRRTGLTRHGSRKQPGSASTWQRGTRACSARGASATSPRKGREMVQRFQDCVFEVQQPAPSRGSWPPRAGRRGVPPKRGHGQDARRTWLKRPRTRAGGWRTKRS